MFIKSVTGSKKTVTLLNKMGHCASYNTIEEIETEMTYTARKNKDMLPTGMKKDSSTGIGVAFDNYDRFVETKSGKNTLHDTVGIAYYIKRSFLPQQKT